MNFVKFWNIRTLTCTLKSGKVVVVVYQDEVHHGKVDEGAVYHGKVDEDAVHHWQVYENTAHHSKVDEDAVNHYEEE